MSTTLLEPAALTAEDRCDRCIAQAFVRVVLPHGELLFCGHHYSRHAPTLRPLALRVDDFRDQMPA